MASNNYYYSQHKGAKIDSAINYINDGLPSELNNINNNLDNVTEIAESAVSALGGYGVGGTTAYGESWGYIPIVKTDGGLEIGKYIDFHLTSGNGIDRTARIIISDDDGTPRFTLGGSSSSSTAHLTVNNLTAAQFHGTYYGTLGYPLDITLNGTVYTYSGSSANATECATGLVFYAPAEAGTEGYLLLADSDGVPTWTNVLPSTTMFKTSSGASLSLAAFYAAFTSALSSIAAQIADITVTTDMIADGAVTYDKLADECVYDLGEFADEQTIEAIAESGGKTYKGKITQYGGDPSYGISFLGLLADNDFTADDVWVFGSGVDLSATYMVDTSRWTNPVQGDILIASADAPTTALTYANDLSNYFMITTLTDLFGISLATATPSIKTIYSVDEFYGAYIQSGDFKTGDVFIIQEDLVFPVEDYDLRFYATGGDTLKMGGILVAISDPDYSEWEGSGVVANYFRYIMPAAITAQAEAIGELSNLDTDDKSDIVSAINEVKAEVGTASSGDSSSLGGYGVGGTTAYGESWGYIPIVKTDGGLEIGKYIDFHLISNDGIDRKARIIISDDDGTPRFTLGGSSSSSTAHLTVKNVTAEQFHGTYYGTLGYPEEITLNGTTYTYDATNTNATQCATGLVFYAPAEAGTEGYLLLADSDGVPTWTNVLPSTTMFKTSSGSSLSLAAFYAAFTSALSSITEKLSSITTPFSFVDDNDYTSLDSGGNPIVDYVANGFYVPTVYRAVGIQLPSNDSAEDNYIMYRFYVFLPDTTGEQGFSVLDSYGNTIYGEINGIYGLVEVTGFCVRSSTDEYYFTSNVLIECS